MVYNLNFGPKGPIVLKSPFKAHPSPYIPCIGFFVTHKTKINRKNA